MIASSSQMQQYLMHRGAFAQKDVTIRTWHPPPAVKVDMLNSHLDTFSIYLNLGTKIGRKWRKMNKNASEASVWSEPEETSHVPVREKIITLGVRNRNQEWRCKMCACQTYPNIAGIAPLSSTSINAGKFSTSVDQVPLDSIQICPCFHDLPRFSTQLPCPALGIPAPQELQLATSWKAMQNGEERMAQLSHLEILSMETTNLTMLAQMAWLVAEKDVPISSSLPCHGVGMVLRLHLLDAIFCQHGSSTTNAAKVEPPILLARISHLEHQRLVLKPDTNELIPSWKTQVVSNDPHWVG